MKQLSRIANITAAAALMIVPAGLVGPAAFLGAPVAEAQTTTSGRMDASTRRGGGGDADIEELARRSAEILRSGAPEADGEWLVPPPANPLREDRAWSVVSALAESIEGYVEGGTGRVGGSGARLSGAARHARTAAGNLLALEPAFDRALMNLRNLAVTLRAASRGRASSELDRRIRSWLEQTLQGALLLGEESLERGRLAGLDEQTLADLEFSVDRARALFEADAHNAGFAELQPAIDLAGNEPRFDLDAFEQGIRDALGDVVDDYVGYQYVINQDGVGVRAGAEGKARVAPDFPPVDQSIHEEMNLASISKTLTGTLVVQRLVELGLTIDDPVEPFLPAGWLRGPNVSSLTFRDLLTHRSGLNQNENEAYTYEALQFYVVLGVDPDDKVWTYQNTNFALFRVLLPYMVYGHASVENYLDLTEELFDFSASESIAALYIMVMRDRLFHPLGIDADCESSVEEPALGYVVPHDFATPGRVIGDWTLLCGSGGWYMSSFELASFLAHRRFTQEIMSIQARELMDDEFLGWFDPDELAPSGAWGVYRVHGGDLGVSDPAKENRGIDTCAADFPDGVQAVLLINSRGGSYPYQCNLLAAAYDASFTVP